MKVIADKEEMRKFYDLVVPPLGEYETGFVSLSARNKYLTEEEREFYKLGRSEMFARTIMRYNSFDKFYSYVARLEAVDPMAYTTKNGKPLPDKATVCYYNINPSNVLKSLNEFSHKMNDYYLELASCGGNSDIAKRFCKTKALFNNCFQKNRGRKIWVDIDFDIPKELKDKMLPKIEWLLGDNGIKTYYWIDTKSGFHLLLKRDELKFDPNKICHLGNSIVMTYCKQPYSEYKDAVGYLTHEEIERKAIHDAAKYEVVVNTNNMVPLPGTYQGEHVVKILTKE